MPDGAKRIMLVDGNRELRGTVSEWLTGEGYEVAQEEKAKHAWHALNRQRPDVLVIEAQLPDMSGIHFLRMLRDEPAFEDLSVLVFTVREDLRDFFETIDIQGFVSKKAGIVELERKIRDILGRPSAPSIPLRGKILVVEDGNRMASALNQALTASGYQVTVVANGLAAETKALEVEPDGIVMNYFLPGMNGEEAAAVIKRTPALASVPIVIYDDSGLDSRIKHALEGRVHIERFVHTADPQKIARVLQGVLGASRPHGGV